MRSSTVSCALYVRLSLDRNGDEHGVQRQEEVGRRLAGERGWNVVEVYADNDISAYDERKTRPAYERMRRDMEAGRFRALIVWDLDRLTRQPKQLEGWIAAAERGGLILVESDGEHDLSTESGRLFARIKTNVARYESEHKAKRQRLAHEQRAKQGRPFGPRRPFGYSDDKRTPHPVEAPIVRQMYADYLAGSGQHAIARDLNDRGVTTTLGGQWKQNVVRDFLRHPRNAGLSTYRGEVVGEGDWAPLVDRQTWEAAVARMDQATASRRAGGWTNNNGQQKYLLPGIATCGRCGAPMRTGYSPSQKRNLECSVHRHVTRRADFTERLVVRTVLELVSARGLAALPSKGEDVDREALALEAETLRQRQEALGTELADGGITPAQLRAFNERIEARSREIHEQLATVDDASVLAPLVDADDAAAAWDALGVARQRTVVRALVDVVIWPTRQGAVFNPEDVTIRPKGSG